ncbi:hypothetical protein PUNSTDRAFT_117905 [Punctularia strigosozonata HHB-11173 SS5]|uniref:uncharacterized protein n=1 Tax=Punctularia strigosozonata (strain HHB-11173) TaxID=741275 RepID=UPI00044180C0|nr:uncharacterized protein PUNSTDRAFT_117905 [Punctularia strigosozonata HHB-11173 SS5]EIN14404.1 hypothetical protein PUNSTDRAFT_117905 [Punctularia strigosozonata HHB-11173 SS5]
MWCDNCLLVFPLRAGAMAWAALLMLYSAIGGMFLILWGQWFLFTFPEWFIYGGIGLAVAAIALINIFALSNRSYIWTRVCKSTWPFLIVISAVRAILILVELQRGKGKIAWECDNGRQIWPESESYANAYGFPAGFCTPMNALFIIWFVALVIDLVWQIYMFFLTWRFAKRLEHYRGMQGPFNGGYYKA